MKKLQVLKLSIPSLIFRYYLMIGTVTVFGMLQQWEVAAVAGIGIAVLAILGVSYSEEPQKVAERKHLQPLKEDTPLRKAG